MINKHYSDEELKIEDLKLHLPAHIVRDLKIMETNTKRPVDELVKTALLMFIATHNDFLGKSRLQ